MNATSFGSGLASIHALKCGKPNEGVATPSGYTTMNAASSAVAEKPLYHSCPLALPFAP